MGVNEEKKNPCPYIIALKRERKIASSLTVISLFLAIVMSLFSAQEAIIFLVLTSAAIFGGWAIGIDNALEIIKEEAKK